MKRGPFFQVQEDAGATYLESNGWQVPAAFKSPEGELRALLESVGLVDLAGWGVLRLSGNDRLDFVHRMSTNDVLRLTPYQGAPTVFTTPIGRIVDLAFVIVRGDDLLLLIGRGADQVVAPWLQKHIFFNDDVVVENMTLEWGMMGCCGPRATALLTDVVNGELEEQAAFQPSVERIAGIEVTMIRSVPLGNDFLLMVRRDDAAVLWSVLVEAIESVGGAVVGEMAAETARVAAGWPRFGSELSEDYIPLEAGLKWAISFSKGCYIGQEIIARMETYQRLAKQLVVLGESAMLPQRSKGHHSDHLHEVRLAVGAEVRDGDSQVGQVTSVAPLIDGGAVKALAYVKTAAAKTGRTLYVATGADELAMTVLAVPGEGE